VWMQLSRTRVPDTPRIKYWLKYVEIFSRGWDSVNNLVSPDLIRYI
jgi:hypothetical protein